MTDIIRQHGLEFHLYADDTQMYLTFNPINEELSTIKSNIESCVSDIRVWMSSNCLKLNDKSELLIFHSQRVPRPNITAINIGEESISPVESCRNIGVIYDETLSFDEHISSITKTAFWHLRNIYCIRHYLDTDSLLILVHAFITSKLDFCNSLLIGLPKCLLKRLQSVQNAFFIIIILRIECEAPLNFRILALYKLFIIIIIKGNSREEAAVKVAKTTLKKSADFQTAMLNYRNTPPQGHTYSPAQRMLCQRTRTTLPTPNHLIKPLLVNLDVVTQELTLKRAASKRYYDSSPTKVHPELAVGSSVYAKPPPTQRSQPWIRGTIVSQDAPRTYTIQTPNSSIRRNRVHIMPTVEQSPSPTQTNPPPLTQEPPPDNGNLSTGPQAEEPVANNHPPAQTLPPQHTGTETLPSNRTENLITPASQDKPPEPTLGNTRTRTRIIKPPLRLKDYELT